MQLRLMVVLTGWMLGWWLLWAVPRLGAGRAGDRTPPRDLPSPDVDVAVVIPARDEEGSLPHLLDSLAGQAAPPRQIVVVDDQSSDATAVVAARSGVQVLAGEPLPEGWTGKAWACHQAMAVVDAEVVVFLDADVTLAPGGLAAILAEQSERGGLLSVQPFHVMKRSYERLSALFNVIGMMGIGAASPGRDGRSHGAFGPVLACTRQEYDLVGGHGSVRGEIVEDIALAHRFEANGLAVSTLGGGDLASFRMYPDGPAQLLEGWSKNIAAGAGSLAWPRLLTVGFWMTTLLVTVQVLLEAVWGLAVGGDVVGSLGAALIGYLCFAVQLRVMLRQLGNFGVLAAACFPVLAVAFLVVFVRSAWLTLVRRRVEWRGRTIPLSDKSTGTRERST